MRTNHGRSCKVVFPLSALSNLPSSSFRPLVPIQTCWPSALWHFQKQKAIKYKRGVSVHFFFPWSFCFHLILSSIAKSCVETPVRPGKVVMNYWSLTASSKRSCCTLLGVFFFFFSFYPTEFYREPTTARWRRPNLFTNWDKYVDVWKKKEKPGRPGANTLSLRA